MKFSVQKSNLYSAIVCLTAIPLYWVWPIHSDWTRERMWHYIIPVSLVIPCYGVWTYVSVSETTQIAPIAMYGMGFLGQLVVISQPIILSYRSSTLYGAAEQAVGGAAAVGSLSIASIIAPQVSRIKPVLSSITYKEIDISSSRCTEVSSRICRNLWNPRSLYS